MRNFLIAVMMLIATPVLADDAYWPGQGAENGVFTNGEGGPALPSAKCPASVWTTDLAFGCAGAAATAADKGGQHTTSAADLDAQRQVNYAARQETRNHMIEAGGCSAPSLPVEIHAYCSRSAANPNPLGGAVGEAGGGGSDGNDGGEGEAQ